MEEYYVFFQLLRLMDWAQFCQSQSCIILAEPYCNAILDSTMMLAFEEKLQQSVQNAVYSRLTCPHVKNQMATKLRKVCHSLDLVCM
jgi:hypothetical protein